MATERFKRYGSKFEKKIQSITVIPQLSNVRFTGSAKLNDGTQIDAFAKSVIGSESGWVTIASRNVDRLLAWDLDTKYITVLDY